MALGDDCTPGPRAAALAGGDRTSGARAPSWGHGRLSYAPPPGPADAGVPCARGPWGGDGQQRSAPAPAPLSGNSTSCGHASGVWTGRPSLPLLARLVACALHSALLGLKPRGWPAGLEGACWRNCTASVPGEAGAVPGPAMGAVERGVPPHASPNGPVSLPLRWRSADMQWPEVGGRTRGGPVRSPQGAAPHPGGFRYQREQAMRAVADAAGWQRPAGPSARYTAVQLDGPTNGGSPLLSTGVPGAESAPGGSSVLPPEVHGGDPPAGRSRVFPAAPHDKATRDDASPGPFAVLRSQTRTKVASSLSWLQKPRSVQGTENKSGLPQLSATLVDRALQWFRTVRSSVGPEDESEEEEQQQSAEDSAAVNGPARDGTNEVVKCPDRRNVTFAMPAYGSAGVLTFFVICIASA